MAVEFNPMFLREYGELGLDRIPREVQVAYLARLYDLGRLGGLEQSETDAIACMAASLGASEQVVAEAREARLSATDRSKLLSGVSALYLVRDAVRLAFSDGVVSQEERDYIAGLAREAGLPTPLAAWIFQWVEREANLRNEWWAILEAHEE